MLQKRILIIDDEESILISLRGVLEDERFTVETAHGGSEGVSKIGSFKPDVVLLDIWMPDEDGLRVLARVRKQEPELPVIMMSGHGTVETAVRSIKLGAFDFIEKPIHLDRLLLLIQHALSLKTLERENQLLRKAMDPDDEVIGTSSQIQALRKAIATTGPSNGWVMLEGENGTGKELVARALHRASPRKSAPFIAVNCAAIPDELVASELFGHEKGAFFGASERKLGKFELAHQGTLFLDEVGDMDLKVQAKILRALQECRIERVGGREEIEVDIRVIAATNKDLRRSIRLGEFREDLFYRLNVIPIRIPALRERREDIPALAKHFVNQYSGGRRRVISESTLALLQSYPWPGNVRELKNWAERACILSSREKIESGPPDINSENAESDPLSIEEKSLRSARAAFEKEFILRMLHENDGNVTRTAQAIGVERSHLHKKIRSYGIELPTSINN